jgi:hypothetical protein
MTGVANTASAKVRDLLTTPAGLRSNLSAITAELGVKLPEVFDRQIMAQNVSLELVERSTDTGFPALQVYCERVINDLKEKFRTFSGKAEMAVEVRASQDRLEGLEEILQAYVSAVTRVLDQNRGDWGDGMFFGGAYEAAFGPVKRGGRNFVQVAKVKFELGVSRN